MAVSLKDLARIAGVSTTTVVRALNDKPDISAVTKRRIVDLADNYNYRPNALARGLVTSKTWTVGIVLPDIANPFFPALTKGAEAALRDKGYNVILTNTDYDRSKEFQAVEELLSRKVDGIIVSPISPEGNMKWLSRIRDAEVPVVSLSRIIGSSIDTVVAADQKGAFMATEHLLSLGRKCIGYLGNSSGIWANRERLKGFFEAHKTAGLKVAEKQILDVEHGDMDRAYAAVKCWFEDAPAIDSLLVFDDIMAFGARMAIEETGRRIPDDIALVSFDNIPLSSLPSVSLTTVDIPKYEIGKEAADVLLRRIENPEHTVIETVLNPSLVIRESCGDSIPLKK